ncbi:hypothetical protein LA52FAK_13460 [Desulforhopalus sp. 52FAK]
MEVWLRTYSVDGIRSENSTFAISTFTEEALKNTWAKFTFFLLNNKYIYEDFSE